MRSVSGIFAKIMIADEISGRGQILTGRVTSGTTGPKLKGRGHEKDDGRKNDKKLDQNGKDWRRTSQ